MKLTIVAAISNNGVIGRDGDLPAVATADLRFFKRVTMGHHVVMGRKTWESIGRPLPGRTIVVLTRDLSRVTVVPGVCAVESIGDALALARQAGDPEVMIAGGAELYAQILPLVGRMYITRVLADVEGDARFPPYSSATWHEISREEHAADAHHQYAFTTFLLERKAW